MSNNSNLNQRIIQRAAQIIEKRQEPTPLIFILMNLYEKLTPPEIKALSVHNIIEELNKSGRLQGTTEYKENPLWQKWTLKNVKFDRKRALETIIKNELEELLLYENETTNFYIKHISSTFKGDLIVSAQRVKRLLEQIAKADEKTGILELTKNKGKILHRKREETINNLAELGRKYKFHSLNVKKKIDMQYDELSLAIKKFIPRTSKRLGESVLFWLKNNKPVIMYYITLTGRKPNVDIKTVSKALSNNIVGFQKIMIFPSKFEKYFKRMKEHWDYILLENIEKVMKEKKVIDKMPRLKYTKKEHGKPKKRVMATVIKNIPYQVGSEIKYFRLVLEKPHIQQNAKPGQFINILCPSHNSVKKHLVFDTEETYKKYLKEKKELYTPKPLLRRPISIHRIYYEGFDPRTLKGKRQLPPEINQYLEGGIRNRFDILVKIVGKGTKALSEVREGDKLDIIGPLGHEININPSLKKALLVAGGIGIAPLYALAEKLRWENKNVVLFLGTFAEQDLKMLDSGYTMGNIEAKELIKEFEEMGIEVKICAQEKGYKGLFRGKVHEIFRNYIEKNKNIKDFSSNTEVFSCGPKEMLKEIVKIATEFNLPHQVLLEERMGCGLGVCLSCVCPTIDNNEIKYKQICMEGPAFNAEEIAWDKY
ncbi:MAG: hypothetical protein HY755_00140 [Nitrospirae bacterium]|nr:hypothetical protein [Nitrospirota bacterium]